jgi:hypothetical protein
VPLGEVTDLLDLARPAEIRKTPADPPVHILDVSELGRSNSGSKRHRSTACDTGG